MGGAQCLVHAAVDKRERETDACFAYTCDMKVTQYHVQQVCSVCGECAVQ